MSKAVKIQDKWANDQITIKAKRSSKKTGKKPSKKLVKN